MDIANSILRFVVDTVDAKKGITELTIDINKQTIALKEQKLEIQSKINIDKAELDSINLKIKSMNLNNAEIQNNINQVKIQSETIRSAIEANTQESIAKKALITSLQNEISDRQNSIDILKIQKSEIIGNTTESIKQRVEINNLIDIFKKQRVELETELVTEKKHQESIQAETNKINEENRAIQEKIIKLQSEKIATDAQIISEKESALAKQIHIVSLNEENKALQESINEKNLAKQSLNEQSQAYSNLSSVVRGVIEIFRVLSHAVSELADNKILDFTNQVEVNLRNVNAIVQESEVNFQKTTKALEDMASGEQLSGITDLSKALYTVQSAGFSGADGLHVLDQANKTAYAGLADLTKTVDGLTSVLNAYGYGANKSAEITDIMIKTVHNGKLTMDQLVGVLGQAVSIAPEMHLAFSQVGAAIATMTTQGVNANVAVTEMNQVLRAFYKPSKESAEYAHTLGIELNASHLEAVGLGKAVQELVDKTKMFGGDQASVLGKLIPEMRSIRGILKLTADDGQLYNKMMSKMADTTDQTSKALEQQTKTFEYQKKALLDVIEVIETGFGRVMQNILTPFIQVLKYLASAFIALPEPVKTVIEWVTVLGAGIGILSSAVLASIISWTALEVALTAIGLKTAGVTLALDGMKTALIEVSGVGMSAVLAGGVFYLLHELAESYNSELLRSIDLLGKLKGAIEAQKAEKQAKEDEKRNQDSLNDALKIANELRAKENKTIEEKIKLAKALRELANNVSGSEGIDTTFSTNKSNLKEDLDKGRITTETYQRELLALDKKYQEDKLSQHGAFLDAEKEKRKKALYAESDDILKQIEPYQKAEKAKTHATAEELTARAELQKKFRAEQDQIQKGLDDVKFSARHNEIVAENKRYEDIKKTSMAMLPDASKGALGVGGTKEEIAKANEDIEKNEQVHRINLTQIKDKNDKIDEEKLRTQANEAKKLIEEKYKVEIDRAKEALNNLDTEGMTKVEMLKAQNKLLLNLEKAYNDEAAALKHGDINKDPALAKQAVEDVNTQRTEEHRKYIANIRQIDKLNDAEVDIEHKKQLKDQDEQQKLTLIQLKENLKQETDLKKEQDEQDKEIDKGSIENLKSLGAIKQTQLESLKLKFKGTQDEELNILKASLPIKQSLLDDEYQIKLNEINETKRIETKKLSDELDEMQKNKDSEADILIRHLVRTQEIEDKAANDILVLQLTTDNKKLANTIEVADKIRAMNISLAKSFVDPFLNAFDKIFPGISKIFDLLINKDSEFRNSVIKTSLEFGKLIGIKNVPNLSSIIPTKGLSSIINSGGSGEGSESSFGMGGSNSSSNSDDMNKTIDESNNSLSKLTDNFKLTNTEQKAFIGYTNLGSKATDNLSDSTKDLTQSTTDSSNATSDNSANIAAFTKASQEAITAIGAIAGAFEKMASGEVTTSQGMKKLSDQVGESMPGFIGSMQKILDSITDGQAQYKAKITQSEFDLQKTILTTGQETTDKKLDLLQLEYNNNLKILQDTEASQEIFNNKKQAMDIKLADDELKIAQDHAQKMLDLNLQLASSELDLTDSYDNKKAQIEDNFVADLIKNLKDAGGDLDTFAKLSEISANKHNKALNDLTLSNTKHLIEMDSNLQKSRLDLQTESLQKSIDLEQNAYDLKQTLLTQDLNYNKITQAEYNQQAEINLNEHNKALYDINLAQSEKIQSINEKSYNAELSAVETLYGDKIKALQSEADSELKIVQDKQNKLDELENNRAITQAQKDARRTKFNADIASFNPTADFFRPNQTEFETGNGVSSGNTTEKSNTENNFSLGIIDDAERAKERVQEALEEFKYYKNQESLQDDPELKKADIAKEQEAQKDYYDFIIDKDKEKIDSDTQQAQKKLDDDKKNLAIATTQEKTEVDKLDAAYKDSSGNYNTYFVQATTDWTNKAKTQVIEVGEQALITIDKARTTLAQSVQDAIKIGAVDTNGIATPSPVTNSASTLSNNNINWVNTGSGNPSLSPASQSVSNNPTPAPAGVSNSNTINSAVTSSGSSIFGAMAGAAQNYNNPSDSQRQALFVAMQATGGYDLQHYYNEYGSYTDEQLRNRAMEMGAIQGYKLGTDNVPHDGVFILHEGEGVLNKEENDTRKKNSKSSSTANSLFSLLGVSNGNGMGNNGLLPIMITNNNTTIINASFNSTVYGVDLSENKISPIIDKKFTTFENNLKRLLPASN